VLDTLLADAPTEGRTVLIASHELDRARALAQREVQVVAGQARAGAPPLAPAPALVVDAIK
jgi:energy-coupling factor transporter ATP-binding protein EcfA2